MDRFFQDHRFVKELTTYVDVRCSSAHSETGEQTTCSMKVFHDVRRRIFPNIQAEKKINVSSGSDTTPCCLILAHLYEINVANNILPERSFYNEAISRMSPLALQQDYRKWCSPSGTNVHSICKTCAFLLDPEAKRRLVRVDATDRMSDEVSKFSGYRTGHRFLSFRAPTH